MTIQVTKESVNLREKLNELETNKGLKGNEILQAETAQEVRSLIGAGRKNLIINGGFDVWQRGTSFSSISNGAYCADRFNTSRSHTVNISRVTSGVSGFKYAHRHTNVTAGVGTLYHHIENTGQFYAGQSVTLSFWARASEAIDVRTLRVWDGASYVTSYDVVNITTSWQKITTTQVINSNWDGSEASFNVQVWTGNSSNMSAGSWIETTGVQLELGSVATDFEHRSYGEELALCQRYYQRIPADGFNGYTRTETPMMNNSDRIGVPLLPVTMRDRPTAVAYSTAGTTDRLTEFSSGVARTVSAVYNEGVSGGGYVQLTTSATNPVYLNMTFDAEL